MNLFTKSTPKLDPKKLQKIKDWAYQRLGIDKRISISISQLQCHEPDCPPIETIIAVMTNPPTQFKIHKSASQITEQDIEQLSKSSSRH